MIKEKSKTTKKLYKIKMMQIQKQSRSSINLNTNVYFKTNFSFNENSFKKINKKKIEINILRKL